MQELVQERAGQSPALILEECLRSFCLVSFIWFRSYLWIPLLLLFVSWTWHALEKLAETEEETKRKKVERLRQWAANDTKKEAFWADLRRQTQFLAMNRIDRKRR